MQIYEYGDRDARNILIQPVDRRELASAEHEAALIKELSGADICLAAFAVDRWNSELSPWDAPAVFGGEDFGSGAAQTLEEILSYMNRSDKRYFLGGYSLAGLFALWAVFRTDRFSGTAAVSPSVWFPDFTDYMRENEPLSDCIYLSLGDREERTKHLIMSQVGNAVRECYGILQEKNRRCTLEWNSGNHFKEPELRMAKGFAWLLSNEG
ncbi:MAG: esterase [Oscillospiraceae bacterium]|nr:esterase [Oscillospiraceae bacterium]